MSTPNPLPYRAGDVIRVPSIDEEWLVAYADRTHVWCLGWPLSGVRHDECELVEKASDERHVELLKEIASSRSGDIRTSHARYELERMGLTWREDK